MTVMTIPVLDHGYVRLVDFMGSDLAVVNAARVSFDKEAKFWDEKQEKLLAFLWRNGHTSPFRHATIKFEVYAPLMVARQWWKYVVGNDHTMDGWNESSRRYVTEEPQFYVPEVWRSAPEDKKQGSGEPVNSNDDSYLWQLHNSNLERCVNAYNQAIKLGVAVEQARLLLPAYAMYVRWQWTTSLQGLMHFCQQRIADDAQWEIQQYAKACAQLGKSPFPHSMELINAGQG
jgi:thymidylate synthase (FAD)